ncbi:hypothetical protein [Candidatus Methylocalor cossyra]|uniref:Soluble methane monooxygenase-binding protein MmoD n=1 Tax=Candidatus Methylocalor cossyra TaxID=3108543 RepID=A0ABM9NEH9_9GAMM
MIVNDEIFDDLDERGLEYLSSKRRFEHLMPADAERIELFREGRYGAYAYDLEFGWRWVITRDGQEVQEGVALSRTGALSAVRHVLTFYRHIDRHETA